MTRKFALAIDDLRAWLTTVVGRICLDMLKAPAIVNGAPGASYGTWDEPLCVLGFTIAGSRIARLHLIADPVKLRR